MGSVASAIPAIALAGSPESTKVIVNTPAIIWNKPQTSQRIAATFKPILTFFIEIVCLWI
ncbi:MAG: hypothetical protein ACI9UV_001808 [Algoriphagus sp.]|jgi:hypothetical protein